MASIRKIENKGKPTWQVRWRDDAGKGKTRNLKSHAAAKAYRAQVETDLHRGEYRDPKVGQISFKEYATEWLAVQTFNASTREAVALRLRLHVYPHIGSVRLSALTPTRVQAMLRKLQQTPARKSKPGEAVSCLSARYIGTILANVSTVLNAAVADGRISTNPATAKSVRAPRSEPRKVVPWPLSDVVAVRGAMSARYRIALTLAATCGLRQGEIFGLAVEDVDFLRRTVTVRRQVKIVKSRLVFGPPKGGRERTVPLPDEGRAALAAHLAAYPASACVLPWEDPTGREVEVKLVLSSREGKPVNRNYFNPRIFKPALRAVGVPDTRDNMTHALRHWYASTLLHAGESIKTVSHNLGHADAAFTLRTYTHLMPNSDERTRNAVDSAFSAKTTASRVDSSWTSEESVTA